MKGVAAASLTVNPFTPTFGRIPPVLAGREVMLNNILQALDQGSGNPNLCTIFIGPRGTGKTALMSYLAREAAGLGWISANVSALPGMLDDIIERSTEAADDFIERQDRARVKSISVGQLFGVEWEYRDAASGNWRTRMNHLLNKLAENNIGLLITVDEVRADLDEMIQFASVFQHFVREERKVALLMAGLPANVSSLVSDKRTSFLRRAAQEHLGAIGDYEVAAALRQTIVDAGRSIDDTALEEATAAIDGFPT